MVAPTAPGPASSVPPPGMARAPSGGSPAEAVALGWYELFAYLAVTAVAVACAVVPVVGVAGVVAAAWYLRAGDRAVRSHRVPIRGVGDLCLAPFRAAGALSRSAATLVPVTLYATLAGGVTMLALTVWARTHDLTWPDAIGRWSAATFAWVMLAGPGVMATRRQLVRLLSASAQGRRRALLAGLITGLSLVLAFGAARAFAPHWWPLHDPHGFASLLPARISSLLRHR